MSRIKKFVNKFIFKKRYIYSLKNTEKVSLKMDGTELIVLKGSSLLENKLLFKDSTIKNEVFKRSKNESVFCLACVNKNKELVGYFWGIVPKDIIWHDSIPIRKGQGFLFNGYVNPEFRGKNVFPYLIYKSSQYIINEYNVNEIIDVVEKQNFPSLKAHKKVGAQLFSNNYLIKLLGKNVITVYKGKFYIVNRLKRNNTS